MRLLFILSLMVIVPLAPAMAQQDERGSGRTIYNRSQTTASPNLYNSPGGPSGTRGPLSLRQMLQGKNDAANGSVNSYYGGSNFRPYGIDNNSYSLSLSPQEIKASRARRDALAQQRERESLQDIETADIQGQTAGFLNQFQGQNATGATAAPQQRRRFRKRESGFEMPRKVFNSIR